MIQLSFQPALDPLHTAFRLLRQRELIKSVTSLHWQQIRIIDFFIAFPYELSTFRFSREDRRFKKIGSAFEHTKGYARLPESRILFSRMSPIQSAAMKTLISSGFYYSSSKSNGEIAITDKALPISVQNRLEEINKDQHELMEIMVVLATKYDLLGHGGLKERSNLMDHRYDVAI